MTCMRHVWELMDIVSANTFYVGVVTINNLLISEVIVILCRKQI